MLEDGADEFRHIINRRAQAALQQGAGANAQHQGLARGDGPQATPWLISLLASSPGRADTDHAQDGIGHLFTHGDQPGEALGAYQFRGFENLCRHLIIFAGCGKEHAARSGFKLVDG